MSRLNNRNISQPKNQPNSQKTIQSEKMIKALEKALKEIHSIDFLTRTTTETSMASIISTPGQTKLAQSNKGMQSDQTTRYARGLTADARRYVFIKK